MSTFQDPSRKSSTNLNLRHLKLQAKELLKAHQAGEADACARIGEFFPRLANASPSDIRLAPFSLQDAQLVIAREYGFSSWPKLVAAVGPVSQKENGEKTGVRLIPMGEKDFEAYRTLHIQKGERDFVKSGVSAPDRARQDAENYFRDTYPEGLSTKDQRIFSIYDETLEEKVGCLSLNIARKHRVKGAWLYGFVVYEEFLENREAYGEQSLRIVEEKIKGLDLAMLTTRVSPQDKVEQAVYKKMGYELLDDTVTDLYFWKRFDNTSRELWEKGIRDQAFADRVRDHLKPVEDLHRQFTRRTGDILSECMEKPVNVSVKSISVCSYSEFHGSLPDPRYTWTFFVTPMQCYVAMDFSVPLSVALWTQLRDGEGPENESEHLSLKEYWAMSDAVGNPVNDLIHALESFWQSLIQVEVDDRYTGWAWVLAEAVIPGQEDPTAPDEVVCHLVLDVQSDDLSGRISICYPTAFLKAAIPYLEEVT